MVVEGLGGSRDARRCSRRPCPGAWISGSPTSSWTEARGNRRDWSAARTHARRGWQAGRTAEALHGRGGRIEDPLPAAPRAMTADTRRRLSCGCRPTGDPALVWEGRRSTRAHRRLRSIRWPAPHMLDIGARVLVRIRCEAVRLTRGKTAEERRRVQAAIWQEATDPRAIRTGATESSRGDGSAPDESVTQASSSETDGRAKGGGRTGPTGAFQEPRRRPLRRTLSGCGSGRWRRQT